MISKHAENMSSNGGYGKGRQERNSLEKTSCGIGKKGGGKGREE